MLNPHVDQIYCVNLKRRADRKERFLKRLAETGTDTSKLTFIEAVDGKELKEVPKEFNHPWPPHQSPSAYGCQRSHVNTIQDAKDNGYETILIFEDDVTFRPNFQKMATAFFENVPNDWQSIFLGANITNAGFGHLNPVNDFCAQGLGYTTHSYLLKKSLFDIILLWGDVMYDTAIDIFYANAIQPSDTNYFAYPLLCSQEPGVSDVENREVDHRAILGNF